MILSWGSPKGAILEALERLRRRYKIGFIQVRMVHPFPASYISSNPKRQRQHNRCRR
ncbi:hypothetical protein KEJ49_05735 [Candidatus Bathyarchaeota archaeon]|nr:hypothetical protein [Candidatus Bathyarchaeota archaeon]